MRSTVPLLLVIVAVGNCTPAAAPAHPSCGQVQANALPDDRKAPRLSASRVQTGNALVGGDQADYGTWPWTVSICIQDWFGTCLYQAAGAIIDSNWIVTSHSAISLDVVPSTLRVRAGTINHDKNGQFVKVRDVHNPTDGGDIALIRLDAPLIFGNYTQPICLPKEDADVVRADASSAWFTSWGLSSPAFATIETYLQQGKLWITANSNCELNTITPLKAESQLCAGGFYGSGGTATCKYDMGGPLMQKRGDTWYLFGISSTTNYAVSNCKSATVFTRVKAFCDWLAKTTGVACIV